MSAQTKFQLMDRLGLLIAASGAVLIAAGIVVLINLWPPLGYFVGGALLIGAGLLISARAKSAWFAHITRPGAGLTDR